MRYPASYSADLSNPQHPPAFMGGQGKVIRQMVEIWPGIFKIAICGTVIMAFVIGYQVATHPRVQVVSVSR